MLILWFYGRGQTGYFQNINRYVLETLVLLFVTTESCLYDLDSLVKRTSKVIPDTVFEFDLRDVDRIMELYGEDEVCRDFTIKNRRVRHRMPNYGDTP